MGSIPSVGDLAWARALAAWRVPSLPSLASKQIGAVIDRFVGQGFDDKKRLKFKVRWLGYGPREDSWHYVEDVPAEKVRQHSARHRLTMRTRVQYNLKTPSTGYPSHTPPTIHPTQPGTSMVGDAADQTSTPRYPTRTRVTTPYPASAGGRLGRTPRSGRSLGGPPGTPAPTPGPRGPDPTTSAAPYSAPPRNGIPPRG